MICNPMLQQGNPFEAWQRLWLQGMHSLTPQQPAQPALPAPADMFGQFQAMQNMWLQSFGMVQLQAAAQPAMQAPKITVTTIELGDMRPYMEMASTMMQAFAPMMMGAMGGAMNNHWGRR